MPTASLSAQHLYVISSALITNHLYSSPLSSFPIPFLHSYLAHSASNTSHSYILIMCLMLAFSISATTKLIHCSFATCSMHMYADSIPGYNDYCPSSQGKIEGEYTYLDSSLTVAISKLNCCK